MTIAALYVEKDGPYFGLPGVDPWDRDRDARKYAALKNANEEMENDK